MIFTSGGEQLDRGAGLLRGGAAYGGRVGFASRHGGVGGCLGGKKHGAFRHGLELPPNVTLLGGHFGNSGLYGLRNHGTSDDRTWTTTRVFARRV